MVCSTGERVEITEIFYGNRCTNKTNQVFIQQHPDRNVNRTDMLEVSS